MASVTQSDGSLEESLPGYEMPHFWNVRHKQCLLRRPFYNSLLLAIHFMLSPLQQVSHSTYSVLTRDIRYFEIEILRMNSTSDEGHRETDVTLARLRSYSRSA
jgi:hypothetical protein